MRFFKIINYYDQNGVVDYKGLDIDKIVAGTQAYDHLGERCLIGYEGEYDPHPEIVELTSEQYETEKQDIIASYPPAPATTDQRVEALEQENAELKARLNQTEQEHADLLLALVAQGVI